MSWLARLSLRRPFRNGALCVALASGALASAALADPLTLAEATRLARGQSRQLAAQDAAVVAAQESSVAARQLPDPVLRLGIDNLPIDGPDRWSVTQDFMTMRRIGVMQEFPRGEKRRLRSTRGEREAERETETRRAMLSNVQRDTALAWLERYYTERMVALQDRMLEDTRSLIAAAEAAYRGGRGAQAEVLGARALLVNLEDRRAMLERQSRAARIALGRWIGADAERELADAPDTGKVQVDIGGLDHELRTHPQLAALAKQVEVAETDARLAREAKKPDWSLELAYQQRGPAFSNMVSVGVSIPLPIAQGVRQDRDLAAKAALADQARAQLDDALRAHSAEVRAMVAEWESDRQRLERIEAGLVPLAAQRSEAALAAYRGNTGTLSAVLEARRGEREARMQALQLAAETARLWAQINFLVPDEGVPHGHGASAGGEK
jgi:outer membrane protein TolC